MMLMMISAKIFLAACSAQAGARKKKTGMKPQRAELIFPGAMRRLREKIGPGPVLRLRAYPNSGREQA